MNHCVPDWSLEDNSRPFTDLLPVSDQKKSMGPDQELAELLWRNGQVFLNSQNNRKPITIPNEPKHTHRPEEPLKGGVSFGNSGNLIQEDGTASWLLYPLDESIEKEFCSDLFYEIPAIAGAGMADISKPSKEVAAKGEKQVKFGDSDEPNVLFSDMVKPQPAFEQSTDLNFVENMMSPPKSQVSESITTAFNSGAGRMANFSHFSRPSKASLVPQNNQLGKKASGNVIHGEVGGSSMMSNCGSNQVENEGNLKQLSSIGFGGAEDDRKMFFASEKGQMGVLEPTITTSSSGGSRGSLGRTSKETASNQSLKRKSRDVDESECQSEETEFESVDASKPSQRSASARRSRAAEVHNLSERRRRDKINKKMKALQELIPHSNKTDKASMLDEAIEYLKSLQLQVQMMWMGSGMAPMMFPGVQHYMSPMGMGVGHAPIHGPVRFPRVPLIDQTITSSLAPNRPPLCPSPIMTQVNFQNQMQNANMPESYAQYLGFHPMQAVPQAMNLFTYGSQRMQHAQRIVPPDSGSGPCNGVPSNNIQNGNSG